MTDVPAQSSSQACWLVTGATGFVGRALCRRLVEEGVAVRAAVRSATVSLPVGVEPVVTGDVATFHDWPAVLSGVDVVANLAGQAHDRGPAADAATRLQAVNAEFPAVLAQAVVEAGVGRLLHLSSVKAMAGACRQGVLRAEDQPEPADEYGRSKRAGEVALQAVMEDAAADWTIIRPTLVYGDAPPGHLRLLLNAIERDWPLPLARIRNRRSLLSRDALVELLLLCGRDAAAGRRVYLAADGNPISTPEMIRALAKGRTRQPRLWPLPRWVLRAGLIAIGRGHWWDRLAGDLQVDASPAMNELGWQPPLSSEPGLDALARSWRERAR